MKIKVNIIFGLLFLFIIKIANGDEGGEGGGEEKATTQTFDEEKCKQIQPTKGIEDECIKGVPESDEKVCCYVKIKFKYNNYYECYPSAKDKAKEKKEELKKQFDGNKVSIYCNSTFINISFILLSLFFFI